MVRRASARAPYHQVTSISKIRLPPARATARRRLLRRPQKLFSVTASTSRRAGEIVDLLLVTNARAPGANIDERQALEKVLFDRVASDFARDLSPGASE